MTAVVCVTFVTSFPGGVGRDISASMCPESDAPHAEMPIDAESVRARAVV
jgi:hypothetical protein